MRISRPAALAAIGIGLPGAFERDLVLRDFAAFAHGRGLALRIWLGLRWPMRNLMNIDRVMTVDWSDHGGLLKEWIGPAVPKL